MTEMSHRKPQITKQAVDDVIALGIEKESAVTYLRQACRYSAPITDDRGQFRYEEFVLDIEDGILHGVYQLQGGST